MASRSSTSSSSGYHPYAPPQSVKERGSTSSPMSIPRSNGASSRSSSYSSVPGSHFSPISWQGGSSLSSLPEEGHWGSGIQAFQLSSSNMPYIQEDGMDLFPNYDPTTSNSHQSPPRLQRPSTYYQSSPDSYLNIDDYINYDG